MLKDFFIKLKPMDEDTLYDFNHIGTFIAPLEKERLEQLLKTKKAKLKDERFLVDTCLPEHFFPILVTKEKDEELLAFIESINTRVREGVWKEQTVEFAKNARNWLEQNIASQIVGLQKIKSSLISLLSAKRIHVLLIGDAVITEQLLSAVASIAPNGVKGLAKELQQQNLLAKASSGVCCVQDVQGLQSGDRTMLYTAMEHGYVKIDHGAHHERMQADICVLAATGSKGVLKANTDVKKATGLDKAFLGRFHLIFLLPKDSYSLQKTKPVSANDIAFVKKYLSIAATHNPSVPIELAEKARTLHEKAELVLALAKANARLELRDEVLRRDIEQAQAHV